MKKSTFRGVRSIYAILAIGLVAAVALPIFNLGKADAASFGTRSIQMSDSTPGATGVTYSVTVTPQATGNVLGVVLDFCDNSPIIGDSTCTATAGTDTPNVGSAALATWTHSAFTTVEANNRVAFTIAANTWTINTPVTLTITNVTNPTNVNADGSFYARVLSYNTAANAVAYTPGAVNGGTGVIDSGGFALSTAANLTVTAKVMEKLYFCVFTLADCATGGTSVVIGDANGALDEDQAYHNANADFTLRTNAQGGAVVKAKTFGGTGAQVNNTLSSGTTWIDAINAGSGSAASNDGTEQFGFCVAATGGTAFTASAPYNGANCAAQATGAYDEGGTVTTFAYEWASLATTFGQEIAKSAGATDTATGTLDFLGNIAITTEAGIYTARIGLIATATF